MVLAMVMLSVPIPALGIAGSGGVDILGREGNGGIFETEGSAFNFPEMQDTNVDTLTVGNDKALALGNIWKEGPIPTAINDLVIKKNQDSGECIQADCCQIDNASPCTDCCVKVNLEDVNVRNRVAMAYGPASAGNYIKIVTNQQ
jgi:hypothetical protein